MDHLGHWKLLWKALHVALASQRNTFTKLCLKVMFLNYIQLFGNMDKGTRNKIRKASRDGIKIYHGSIDEVLTKEIIQDVYEVDCEVFRHPTTQNICISYY